MRTKLFAAQDALYGLLRASSGLAGVSVILGTPFRPEHEMVWISGEVDEWSRDYRTSGLVSQEESFTIRVHITSARLGTEYTPTRDRVKALGDAIDDVITANPQLSGTVMLATIARAEFQEAADMDGRGRAALLTLYIECSAFVSA